MKTFLSNLIFTCWMICLTGTVFSQGVTTSGLNGKVTDQQNGEALPGATVIAEHEPSGTEYGITTDINGFFRIPNMRVGGPYTVTVSFVGYETLIRSSIYLALGQTYYLELSMGEEAAQLEEVVIVADQNDIFDGNRTGQETTVDQKTLQQLPTISRAIGDFARYNPLANIGENTDGFTISLAGQNNRFNTIYIDGAVNNDAFGLAGSGTNGGQTGVQPISIDAIEQFTISIAPFDVRQSGFAGGAINAVTRSGTNNLEGSAYYLWRNDGLAGKTPTNNDDITRERLAEFTAKTYGVRLGGPIVKDKVFFFVNAEFQRDETPQPFNFANYDGDSDRATINAIRDKLINDYGYNPGGFENNTAFLDSDKFLAKLDFNLGKNHKLSVRHSYVKAENLEARDSGPTEIAFINGSEYFVSTTNSSAIELNSRLSNNLSNSLKLGATFVRDDRDPFGPDFPTIQIADGEGDITIGAERFSTANLLNQDIITFNNDLEWFKGKHNFLFGVNFEYFDAGNLFIRNNFGRYRFFGGPSTFLTDDPVAAQFERSYSQVDNVTGDESNAIAAFKQMLIGAYIQDKIQVNDKLNVTAGVRIDFPIWPTDQPVNEDFNNNTIPAIESFGYDLKGARTGQFIDTNPVFSPRVGFNYDINGDQSTQLRGGAGIFTSRIPLVWPGGAYNNYGLNIGEILISDQPFIPDVNNQPPGDIDLDNPAPSGQIDLFAADFKLPQVLKVNLAVDQKLPWGIVATVEGLYTKYLNSVRYENLNLKPSTDNLTGTPDDRPIFAGLNPSFGGDPIDPTYTNIMLASNTSKGYAYNLAVTLQKYVTNRLNTSVSYSYGDSYSLFDLTSSQNNSQWRGYFNPQGRNNEGEAYRSSFAQGHRIFAQVGYTFALTEKTRSMVSLVYNGQAGQPFTYVLGARNFEIVDDGGFSFNELVYIPNDQSEINLVETSAGGETFSPAEQWEILDAFIADDSHLSDSRGGYNERNGNRTPFTNILDLRFTQDFFINVGGKRNTLQFSLDIFNLTNMINEDWGRIYSFRFDTYSLINFEGFESGTNTPTYSVNRDILEGKDPWVDDIDDSGFRSSRWQMQLGVRYTFGG